MTFLLTVLILTLILVALGILFIPFHIGLRVEKKDRALLASINFDWPEKIFNLKYIILKNEIAIYLFTRKIISKTLPQEKTTKEKKRAENRPKKKIIKRTPHKRSLAIPLLKLGLEVLHTFRWEKIYLEIDAGAPDPSTTGAITGYFYALRGAILNNPHLPKSLHLAFHPHFNEERYDIKGELKVKNKIKNFIAPALRFILKKPVQRHIKNTILKW